MSIDITCYTKLNVDYLQEKITQMREKYHILFNKLYVIYDASVILNRDQLILLADKLKQYSLESKLLISEEFGLNDPRSYFMISVNDKSFPALNTSQIAELLREELGGEKIIVLLDNEILI